MQGFNNFQVIGVVVLEMAKSWKELTVIEFVKDQKILNKSKTLEFVKDQKIFHKSKTLGGACSPLHLLPPLRLVHQLYPAAPLHSGCQVSLEKIMKLNRKSSAKSRYKYFVHAVN